MIIRFILLFFFTISFLFASVKKDLITGYISLDNKEFISSKRVDFENDKFEKVWVRLDFDKKLLENKTYYIKVNCDVDDLLYSDIKYKRDFESIIFRVDSSSLSSTKFFFERSEKKRLNFRVSILNEFEYKYIYFIEDILFGLSYGIIFCAFLYNLVLFFYNREKSFFYYSLMQLFLLIILVFILVLSKKSYISTLEQMSIDLFETACVLLLILFSQEILNTKKYMKKSHSILNFFIYLNVVDMLFIFLFEYSVLYEYFPRVLLILFLIFLAFEALFRGQKSAVFYLLGWSVLFTILYISEGVIEINSIYILHFGFPIESLILTFALGYKMKEAIDAKNEKDRILIHQSKLASMGEMINNIAHQWRQPLTHLTYVLLNIRGASEYGGLDEKYLKEKLQEADFQINFMSDTIDSFRDFYKPLKQKEYFSIKESIDKAIFIIRPSLEESQIKLDFTINDDKKLLSYKNEFSQVLLNILTNAKEALIKENIQNPYIKIDVKVTKTKIYTSIKDNAGGIKKENLEKIFEPYYSTKNKGSGIGLYMSRIIIEQHFKGSLSLKNIKNGALFVIEI